jgi:O-acetyl-ADP-ribose deacetylase (regulator of RNase III)
LIHAVVPAQSGPPPHRHRREDETFDVLEGELTFQADGRTFEDRREGRDVIPITYLKGDATSPQAKGVKLIAHICNDRGGWGKGFVVAISKRWPEPEEAYRAWYRERAQNDFDLGAVQIVQVEQCIWVANMIAQHGMTGSNESPPIRYESVKACLETLSLKAQELGASVHMPRRGCGLAGGKWERIEPLISATLCEKNVTVTVYDF